MEREKSQKTTENILRKLANERLRRRINTLFRKGYIVGGYDNVEVFISVRHQGRFSTYRSDETLIWPTLSEIVGNILEQLSYLILLLIEQNLSVATKLWTEGYREKTIPKSLCTQKQERQSISTKTYESSRYRARNFWIG
jgi:hypothetical protein